MTFRPQSLKDFIGQRDLVSNLNVTIAAALKRGAPIDHILLHGQPGLGKTSIAQLVANEMGTRMFATNAPAIATMKDLLGLLMQVKQGNVIFIDEIHRLAKPLSEILYSLMESGYIDVTFGDLFPATYRLTMPGCTIIGATTMLAKMADPLRARFGNVYQLRYYKPEDLAKILANESVQSGYIITPDALSIIAERGRGTPRTALTILRRVADFGLVLNENITAEVAGVALDSLKIDSLGLTEQDCEYLTVLYSRAGGGPRGVAAIASMMNEEEDTVAGVIEPWLLYLGLIERTSSGRILTVKAYQHMHWDRVE